MKIYSQLAALQQELPTINKNATGYGYKFADLEQIVKVVVPLMKKNNLGYTQPLDGTSLKTILFNTEGETIESSVDIPQGVSLKGQNEYQTLGSAITYLRRYSLSSILGLVTDEDADAAGEQTSAPKASTGAPATDKQLALINKLAIEQGMPDDAVNARLRQIKTSDEASEAISKLMGDK